MREEEHSEGGLTGSGRRLGSISGGSQGEGERHQELLGMRGAGRDRLTAPSLIQVVYPSADRAQEEAGHVSSTFSASGSFPSALHLLCIFSTQSHKAQHYCFLMVLLLRV